jgi:thiol-disulfide isomerase/thioredoxin
LIQKKAARWSNLFPKFLKMNKLKFFFLLFLLPTFAVFQACQASDHGLKGTIANAANLQVALDQVNFDPNTTALGRATCDANGAFDIKLEKPFEEGLYRLTIGAKRMFFILNGKEGVVEIAGDLNTIDRMQVTAKGSETLTCYANTVQKLFRGQLSSPDAAKAIVNEGCTPLMQAFLAAQLYGQNPAAFMDELKAKSKALETSMPGSKYAKDFSDMIAKMETQLTQQQAANSGGIQIGQDAPEISLPDPNGKTRALSSLKGKVVLIDFWASWCGPCRRANPHVVEVYNKYKGKGFDVFSVSLDRPDGKEAWKQAIEKDGLVWNNHVSDLKFWDSAPAATYGVRAIPKTFLVGKDGKIVAVDPRNNLEAELLKVL